MPPLAPIFVSDRKAAALMDMGTTQFLSLVADGHLPKGEEIAPGVERWRVEDLQKLKRGELIQEDFEV